MRVVSAVISLAALLLPSHSFAKTFYGPGQFCGYAPAIDLRPDEKVTPLEGGIHVGKFLWEGRFGKLTVGATGWGVKPKQPESDYETDQGYLRFEKRKTEEGFSITIWNYQHAVATFSSPDPLTERQKDAIDRVTLFNEGERPKTCKYSTIFVWNFD
jgi:hypothetical protein